MTGADADLTISCDVSASASIVLTKTSNELLNKEPTPPSLAITSDTFFKSEDCQVLGMEPYVPQLSTPETEKDLEIPIVRPEQSPSKVAISESFISQEELASRQEMKLTSRPTSFDEISSEKKEDSSPVQEATVPQNDSEQQAIKQPFLNKKLLFLSARAHKLMKMKQQAMLRGPLPTTPSSLQGSSSGPSQVTPSDFRHTFQSTQPTAESTTSSLPPSPVLKDDSKKQKKLKTKKAEQPSPSIVPNNAPGITAPTGIFMQSRQSTSSALEDDLEPSIYQGMLPSFSGLEFLYSAGLNSNSFSLEEHVKILLVAEFFRMISSEMLTDWPPVLFEPQLIELALLVPNTSFSPLYVFLVSQLVQLLRTNSIISMIELQGSLDEILIPKVILSNCSASQKLEVLVQLLDQVTQLPWFFKWLDDKASFSATLAQKKRDLLIARDANNHNVHSAETELAHFQARAGYLKEQALLDPSNDFVSMQLKAIDVQITTQRDKLDNFLSRRDELQTWIQEIESTEFTTPGAALLHGQLEGPISDTFVTLLGKDRIGRLFWFWRPIGGIFIEANSCPGLDFPSNTPRWEHVGDKTQFEVLLRSLNPRGHRERILQAQLSTNQKLILDSFSSANRWLQLQRELIALADEQLAPYITAKFAEYRPYLEKLNDAFLARLKNFGADDLLAMFDRSHYDFFVLRAMRERLAKLKLYLYDQSALLFKSSQRGNTGQRLLDALHNADTLEKGVQAAHAMFDFTVPLLEACKGLNTSLTLHEKELKHSLGILFTWIKSSPYFKDILIAATGNPRAKFPTADHFCSWLTRVIDYLTDLHQDNIDDDCLIKQRKFRGLKTQTCHTHSSFDSCHYHCSSLPKSTIVEVHIPRRLESFKNIIPKLSTRPRRFHPQRPTPRRSARTKKPVNYALDINISDSTLSNSAPPSANSTAASSFFTPRKSARNISKEAHTNGSNLDLVSSFKRSRKAIIISSDENEGS